MMSRKRQTLRRLLAVGVTASALGYSASVTTAQEQSNPSNSPTQSRSGLGEGAAEATRNVGDAARRAGQNVQRAGQNIRNRIDGARSTLDGRSRADSNQRADANQQDGEQRFRSSAGQQLYGDDGQQRYEGEQRLGAQQQYGNQRRGNDQFGQGQQRSGDQFGTQQRAGDQYGQGQQRFGDQYGQSQQRSGDSRWQDEQQYGDSGINSPSPDGWADSQGQSRSGTSGRPVYNRDSQGRFYFDDVVGQRFVYTPQGQWMRVQGGGQGGSQWDQSGQSGPRLGVQVIESDRGVQIRDVVRGSAAARAGLRAGDIILRAAGRDVSDPRSFVQQIQGMEQGDDFGLTVLRDGSETELNASLEASDTQRMAKPAMDGERTPESIRQEIQRLEQELERMESQGEGESDDAWSGDRDPNRAQESSGDRNEGSSDIQSRQQLDGSSDDEATRSRSSGDADASNSSDDEGARGDVGAEARTETEADVETDATESAPQPGELNRDLDNRSDDATEGTGDQETDSSLNDLFDDESDSSDN